MAADRTTFSLGHLAYRFRAAIAAIGILAFASGHAAAYNVSTTGGTQSGIGGSADSVTLNPNTVSTGLGAFLFQSGVFSVGDSGNLSATLPVSLAENVTIDGTTIAVTITGTLVVTNPSQANLDDLTINAGSGVQFNAVTLTTGSYNSPGGSVGAVFDFDLSATLTQTQVPEPTSMALLGMGLLGLGLGRRRKAP